MIKINIINKNGEPPKTPTLITIGIQTFSHSLTLSFSHPGIERDGERVRERKEGPIFEMNGDFERVREEGCGDPGEIEGRGFV